MAARLADAPDNLPYLVDRQYVGCAENRRELFYLHARALSARASTISSKM
jgi:hypothetical protein